MYLLFLCKYFSKYFREKKGKNRKYFSGEGGVDTFGTFFILDFFFFTRGIITKKINKITK